VFSEPSGEVDLAVGLQDAAEKWLAERVQEAGIPEERIGFSVRRGHAGEEICAEAKARDADLIVMGTHGKPLAGPTIGSVARYVVGHAPCPVLVIPEADR
jgi:nucleotide-binding universal stress UspA family protein